ncbi:hypothetical protein PanWU01x14_242920 [Parasponia andersonii]|uniref:Uncharacterized protein n=1 Tax=Parasponia andersonii TaxID=3476 RepID=A0A2P5BFU8_PARAD|nr:hypothetical protein PanWU01x14_242920 [Parasponia andersonii]
MIQPSSTTNLGHYRLIEPVFPLPPPLTTGPAHHRRRWLPVEMRPGTAKSSKGRFGISEREGGGFGYALADVEARKSNRTLCGHDECWST